jgi:hypothetical protein
MYDVCAFTPCNGNPRNRSRDRMVCGGSLNSSVLAALKLRHPLEPRNIENGISLIEMADVM